MQRDSDRKDLIEALSVADKTVILYDANLGAVPIANRQKLNHALSTGIRQSTISKAVAAGEDPAEAVRVTEDALSLARDLTFLGQASKKIVNNAKPDLDHMTMPVKLTFEDRGARIHFERTMGARCGLRATMSLPKNIRIAQSVFHDEIKKRYPGQITMVRTDTERLRFIAFHKEDGGPRWIPCMEVREIPLDILRVPPSGVGSDGVEPAVSVGEDGAPPMDAV